MLIQQINWVTRARKAAGGKGPAQAELLEDITQNVQVADLSTFEYDWCGGVRHIKLSAVSAAVAAQLAHVTVFNPVGSGTLAFLDQIELVSGGAGNQQIDGGFFFADTADPIVGVAPQDSRWFPAPPIPATGLSTLIARAGAAVADPISLRQDRYLVAGAGLTAYFSRRIVIAPGSGYVFTHQTLNTNFRVDLYWKERPAESGELPS